ncbi:MAG: LytTR family DNA-binding domain-containing protein [Eubacteriales bacterium]|nr:LytTR family DNA-binding domain-containing protein [Eubacteriales bacterium]
MLYFAIVEDQSAERQLLRNYLEQWASSRNQDLVINEFPSADAFDFAYSEDQRVDCALLDIQMPGQSGVELARRLRQAGQELTIIFITGIVDYIQEGYELEALHYLLKPVKKEDLNRCLDRFLQHQKTAAPALFIKTEDGHRKIIIDDLLYLESERNDLHFQLKDKQQLTVRAALQDYVERLGDNFVLAHRSYLINLAAIEQINGHTIILSSGEQLPVSRRRLSEVNAAFIRYHRGKGLI